MPFRPYGAMRRLTKGRDPSTCSASRRSVRDPSCDTVVVSASTDGWFPRSFVLTDIVDSVSLWERDAELMAEAVARHDTIIGREVDAAGGVLVRSKGEGDSSFSVFAHPAAAVAAAMAIQRAVGAATWPTAVPLQVRAGVHTGDAEPREGDWYGPAVNRAARLRALAEAHLPGDPGHVGSASAGRLLGCGWVPRCLGSVLLRSWRLSASDVARGRSPPRRRRRCRASGRSRRMGT